LECASSSPTEHRVNTFPPDGFTAIELAPVDAVFSLALRGTSGYRVTVTSQSCLLPLPARNERGEGWGEGLVDAYLAALIARTRALLSPASPPRGGSMCLAECARPRAQQRANGVTL